MKLIDIATINPVSIGDTIVTGGMSSYFPEGIPIGRVTGFIDTTSENFYDIDVEYFGTFSGYGDIPGSWFWPTSITQSNEGNIIVTDEYLNRVSFFEPNGQLIRSWGVSGSCLLYTSPSPRD